MLQPGVPERVTRRLAIAATLVALGCDGEGPIGPTVPAIVMAHAALSETNALSVVVSVELDDADSVAVRFGAIGQALAESTPSYRSMSGATVVPVLGLHADTPYALRVVAFGETSTVERDLAPILTGSLPADLPSYRAGGTDPSPGYVAFAAGRYGLVIDNAGRVVWYHAFAGGPGLNFQPQPNGRYVARPPPPDAVTIAPWVEIDPAGNSTRTLTCARGLQPRFHDLIALPGGDYWIMCDETRVMDLSAAGGSPTARVTGTVVQHIGPSGTLLFAWSPFDHFAISDLEPTSRSGQSVNWTHGNAIALDQDGNLVISFRSLSEITKIDTRMGEVMWRMGGLANQFSFMGSPAPAFARQHGVRVTGAGQLTLLDNSGDPLASRAERYVIDEASRTASLVASFSPEPSVRAQLGGTTQDLPGGHALVAFGDGGRVQEYDAAGNVVWQIEGDAGYLFRAHRIRSLYHPEMDSAN
jgi:hypothetical protein